MGERWSADRVLALAPDASSAAAGRKLSAPSPWSGLGTSDQPPALWGLCQGSGKAPYATVVDLAGPAFHCTCPSRKFPCKHALGLLLLWAAGGVGSVATTPAFAEAWLRSRAERAVRAEQRGAGEPDAAAAERRVEQRRRRVADGVAELERWLHDQVDQGLAGADRAGYRPYEQVAARLVDAQAPALADGVRQLAGVAASGEGWPGRLLDEMSLLHLLVRAHARLEDLDDETAAVVRRRLGETARVDDVLARPGVRDRWQVLAQHDSLQGRLVARRVHVRGEGTSRDAVVVAFAPAGQPLDVPLPVGTVVDADLHPYPGDPTRVAVGERRGTPESLGTVAGVGLAGAASAWSELLAADPWATAMPVVLDAVTPVPTPGASSPGWRLVDATGASSPIVTTERSWRLLAVSGGRPVTVVGDRVPAGIAPVAAWVDGELVAL